MKACLALIHQLVQKRQLNLGVIVKHAHGERDLIAVVLFKQDSGPFQVDKHQMRQIFQDKQFHGLQLVIVVNRQLLQNLFKQLEYVFLLLQAFNFDVGLNRVDVVPFQEEQVTVNLFAFKYYLSF